MLFNLNFVIILIVALFILFVIKIDLYSAESTNYTPKYNTLAHKIISREPIDASKEDAYRKLDILIDSVRVTIKKRNKYRRWQTEQIFKTIYTQLLAQGYDYKSNDYLSYGLVNGRLDCDNYSLIYYAVAEVIGLPVYIVNLPEHTTLLWDYDGRHDPLHYNPINEGDFYWETKLGEIRPDEKYIKSRLISKQSVKNRVFLTKMNEEHAYALLHNINAAKFIESGNFNQALSEINRALELNPKFPDSYNNKGIIFSNLKNYYGAIETYDKAVSLHTSFTLAIINKGIAYEKSGDINSAISNYTDSLVVDSGFKPVYLMRSKFYEKTGHLDRALQDLQTYESIK